MTTLTMRIIKGDFVVTGPDIAPMKFKSRPEASDWCKAHHPARRSRRSAPAASARSGNHQSDQAGETHNTLRASIEARRMTHPRPALSLGRAVLRYGREPAEGAGAPKQKPRQRGGRGQKSPARERG